MIYDCFTFFNELELLELRLHELNAVVDKFVLVEATRTFSNKPKPLYFQENCARFSAFEDKIIHIIVEDTPDTSNPWTIERFQRNAIERGLRGCRPNDWVLISDVDEIPRANIVEKMSLEILFHDNFFSNSVHKVLNSQPFKAIFHRKGFRRRLRKNHPFVWKFEQSLHRYYFNCISIRPSVWYGTRMLYFRDFSNAEEVRHSGYRIVKNAGWHFTHMGGVERIQAKISSFSHQEFNQPQFTNAEAIKNRIEHAKSLFGRNELLNFIAMNESFPKFVTENLPKYAAWIKN